MLKKIFFEIFVMIMLAGMLLSCGRYAVPEFENADVLVQDLYADVGFDMSGVYKETLDTKSAYLIGLSSDEFDDTVEDAVIYRKMIDSDGQMLYVLKMKTEDAAKSVAEDYYSRYEWAACDNAEKLIVACAGRYLLCFKSNSEDADTVLESFKSLAGGTLSYHKERINKS